MTHSILTADSARRGIRTAGAVAALAATVLLGACALAPGRPYDLSQVNGGYHEGYAQTHYAPFGENEPTYYPR